MTSQDEHNTSFTREAEQVDKALSCGTVLVLDTAGRACQVGVLHAGGWVQRVRKEMTYGQAECLVPMVKDAMAAAGHTFSELSAVVVTVGPGSFTGLRVGLAAAQGFGVVAECPVVGVSSLQAWAMMSSYDGDIRVCLDSRRGDAFVQDFDAKRFAMTEGSVMDVTQAKALPENMTCIGDLDAEADAPTLQAIYNAASLRETRLLPQPLYLRAPDAVPSCR